MIFKCCGIHLQGSASDIKSKYSRAGSYLQSFIYNFLLGVFQLYPGKTTECRDPQKYSSDTWRINVSLHYWESKGNRLLLKTTRSVALGALQCAPLGWHLASWEDSEGLWWRHGQVSSCCHTLLMDRISHTQLYLGQNRLLALEVSDSFPPGSGQNKWQTMTFLWTSAKLRSHCFFHSTWVFHFFRNTYTHTYHTHTCTHTTRDPHPLKILLFSVLMWFPW
jgi:hypothetical protein